MKPSVILLLAVASTLPLSAQERKPADPKAKPATHSPESSALNTVKQDERNKETIRKAKALLDKTMQRNEAAKKEVDRLEKAKTAPLTDEAKARLEKLKNSVDPKDIEELKSILQSSRAAVEEDVKKAAEAMRERNRREGANPAVPATPQEKDNTAASFDNVATKEPLAVRAEPVFTTPPLCADLIVPAMSRDPKNPSKELPASDPRSRTIVMKGNARLRLPDKVLDADEVEIVYKEGQAPGNAPRRGKKAAPEAAPAIDPVKAGGKKSTPIERIVARGKVRIMFIDEYGRVQAGRGGHMIYEEAKGWFILKDWPEAEAEGLIVRGRVKDSVLRLSQRERLENGLSGFAVDKVDRELTPADVPKDPRTDIPPARPIVPKDGSAPVPR